MFAKFTLLRGVRQVGSEFLECRLGDGPGLAEHVEHVDDPEVENSVFIRVVLEDVLVDSPGDHAGGHHREDLLAPQKHRPVFLLLEVGGLGVQQDDRVEQPRVVLVGQHLIEQHEIHHYPPLAIKDRPLLHEIKRKTAQKQQSRQHPHQTPEGRSHVLVIPEVEIDLVAIDGLCSAVVAPSQVVKVRLEEELIPVQVVEVPHQSQEDPS